MQALGMARADMHARCGQPLACHDGRLPLLATLSAFAGVNHRWPRPTSLPPGSLRHHPHVLGRRLWRKPPGAPQAHPDCCVTIPSATPKIMAEAPGGHWGVQPHNLSPYYMYMPPIDVHALPY